MAGNLTPQEVQQLERGLVRPLQVLQHQHRWLSLGDFSKVLRCCPQHFPLQGLAVELLHSPRGFSLKLHAHEVLQIWQQVRGPISK